MGVPKPEFPVRFPLIESSLAGSIRSRLTPFLFERGLMILRCEGSFDEGNCVRTNFCGGRQESFGLIGLAGNLCYTLTVGAPDDSAAFQDRRYRVFGIAAAHKVVVNIEREFDRDHRSKRLRV